MPYINDLNIWMFALIGLPSLGLSDLLIILESINCLLFIPDLVRRIANSVPIDLYESKNPNFSNKDNLYPFMPHKGSEIPHISCE